MAAKLAGSVGNSTFGGGAVITGSDTVAKLRGVPVPSLVGCVGKENVMPETVVLCGKAWVETDSGGGGGGGGGNGGDNSWRCFLGGDVIAGATNVVVVLTAALLPLVRTSCRMGVLEDDDDVKPVGVEAATGGSSWVKISRRLSSSEGSLSSLTSCCWCVADRGSFAEVKDVGDSSDGLTGCWGRRGKKKLSESAFDWGACGKLLFVVLFAVAKPTPEMTDAGGLLTVACRVSSSSGWRGIGTSSC